MIKRKKLEICYHEISSFFNEIVSGFHRAAQKAVMLYSLFASCKINSTNLIAYKIIRDRRGDSISLLFVGLANSVDWLLVN